MLRSMTGFGRGEAQNEMIRFVVELKTVNHRFLEPSIRMSRKFAAMENDLRAVLAEQIIRGKLDVSVTYEETQGTTRIALHEDTLEQYLTVLRGAGERFGLEDNLKVSNLLNFPEVLEITQADTDTEAIWPVLKEAALKAAAQLNEMRAREGERIVNDLLTKADTILGLVSQLETSAPAIEERYRVRLQERISAILESMGDRVKPDSALLENEIALFADRCCIDEEIVRLKSHVAELKRLLRQNEPAGRPLDFLLQEFNRESNTIASKAGDLSVTQVALALKKEIEKVREQIQNLE